MTSSVQIPSFVLDSDMNICGVLSEHTLQRILNLAEIICVKLFYLFLWPHFLYIINTDIDHSSSSLTSTGCYERKCGRVFGVQWIWEIWNCKEIKRYSLLSSDKWKKSDNAIMFSVHLPYSAVTCNQPIRENSSALKSVLKRTKLPFCSLQHILYLLEKN